MEDESGVIPDTCSNNTVFNLYFCFRNSSNSHVTYKLYTMPTARNSSHCENILSFRQPLLKAAKM